MKLVHGHQPARRPSVRARGGGDHEDAGLRGDREYRIAGRAWVVSRRR